MQKNYVYGMCLVLVMMSIQTFAQERPYPLGKSSRLLQEFREQSKTPNQRGRTNRLKLKTTSANVFDAKINFRQSFASDREHMAGEIEGVNGSSFYLRIEGKSFEGNVVFRKDRKAYRYYSDSDGNAYVEEISIDKVLCIDMDKAPTVSTNATAAAISPALLTLESYPGGRGCVLLDFDGQYVSGTPWNNGNPIDAAPSTMTDAQVQEIWEMIGEDFRPFHLNITTNEAVFNSYPKNRRMRCIFTPTNTAAPGSGGVAYVGSFNWNDDTPCWVFNSGAKAGGEAGSHEVGHTFGLSHDGRTTPAENYFGGHGNWAPIMGVGYSKPVVQWSRGEYTSANNTEDDLTKISSATYGVGYRADDRGNTLPSATPIVYNTSGAVSASKNNGVIDRTADVDVFSFSTSGGTVTLNVAPAARHADLDIKATLYNGSGAVITAADPAGLSASISTSLSAGSYYVSVTGTGVGNPANDGYSNYASFGYYSISGTIPPASTANAVATLYQHCGFSTSGYGIGLPVGSYTTAQLAARGILNNDVSSIQIQSGYEVVLYKGDNFQGAYAGFTSNVDCLTTYTLNDSASSVRVRSVSNQLPLVGITAPVASTSFLAPANITISADASDTDGSIQKVEFFRGATKLGEDLSAPYSFVWSGVAAGSYTLQARATDDRGGQSSAQVNVTVSPVAVTFYKDCSFGGYAVDLAPGNYTLDQLIARGILNDDISSLKTRSGYEVILYQDNNFQGSAYLFSGEFSCLVSLVVNGTALNLNDWASSVTVRASGTATVASAAAAYTEELGTQMEETASPAVTPNPFANQVSIHYGTADESFDVHVITFDGSEVLSTRDVKNGQTIDLAHLHPGIYLLKIHTGRGVITRRVVKR